MRKHARELERRYPHGPPVDGLFYAERFHALYLYVPAWWKPSRDWACELAEQWGGCRQVVVVSGDQDEFNCRRIGDRWEMQRPRWIGSDETKPTWHYIEGAHGT